MCVMTTHMHHGNSCVSWQLMCKCMCMCMFMMHMCLCTFSADNTSERVGYILVFIVGAFIWGNLLAEVCVCMCVCVGKREKERERKGESVCCWHLHLVHTYTHTQTPEGATSFGSHIHTDTRGSIFISLRCLCVGVCVLLAPSFASHIHTDTYTHGATSFP